MFILDICEWWKSDWHSALWSYELPHSIPKEEAETTQSG